MKNYLENIIRLHESRLEFWSNVYKYTKIQHKKKKAETSMKIFKNSLERCKRELEELQ